LEIVSLDVERRYAVAITKELPFVLRLETAFKKKAGCVRKEMQTRRET
jgi:hypothetical protein